MLTFSRFLLTVMRILFWIKGLSEDTREYLDAFETLAAC